MSNSTRTILHVDMDAFFASVEQRDDPTLRGKPVLVGHDGPRGVVAAASYEARAFGCHSAQPIAVAKRLCPHAVIVGHHGQRYRQASAEVFGIFDQFTPLIQPLSIDEAFLDVTGSIRLLGSPVEMAQRIRLLVHEHTQLTASVGVAPNKFLAKLASDMDKPDGLTVIEPDMVEQRLAALPIRRMWGVGPAAEQKFLHLGIQSFGDLRRRSVKQLNQHFGSQGEHFWNLARGIDDRPVVPDHQARSISHEQTFGQDLRDPVLLRPFILDQCEQIARRLRRQGLFTKAVTIKLRYGDFQTITRAASIDPAADTTDPIWLTARDLFDRWIAREGFKPVRLIGVAAGRLTRQVQGDLFVDREAAMRQVLDRTTDVIVEKFGKHAIQRGGSMKRESEAGK